MLWKTNLFLSVGIFFNQEKLFLLHQTIHHHERIKQILKNRWYFILAESQMVFIMFCTVHIFLRLLFNLVKTTFSQPMCSIVVALNVFDIKEDVFDSKTRKNFLIALGRNIRTKSQIVYCVSNQHSC